MAGLSCSWSPTLIVDLIKNIAWPVVVLFIGFSFKARLLEVIRSFFSKNTVSEISATISGVSAKFMAARQSTETLERTNSSSVTLPEGMSVESVKETHEKNKTEYSEKLYQSIIKHVATLDINDEEKIQLLSREVSVLQSAMRYFEINKVLFRSQYDLFCKIFFGEGYIRKSDALLYFEQIRSNNIEAIGDWDWNKYTAYPVGSSLIYEEDDGYKLTLIGGSYVAFMQKRPQLIEELTKL